MEDDPLLMVFLVISSQVLGLQTSATMATSFDAGNQPPSLVHARQKW